MSLVSNLTETCRAWAKSRRGENDLAGTKYIQELVKESKQEIKEAKKLSVFLTDFNT